MKYQNFQEYLNAKGNISEPIVSQSGDHVEKSTKNDKTSKAPKGKKDGGKAFGDLGDKELKIDVDLEGKGKKAAKLPTAEFAKYEFLPLIRETIEADPLITEDIVRELKRHGLLGLLVAEMLDHRETYRHLTNVMAHETYGPDVCRRLVRAMREEVAPPFSAGEDDEDEDDEDFINRDTSDGEGVDDEDEFQDDDVENPEDAEKIPGPPNTVPPPNPTVPGPAMANLQQAMNRI